VRIPEDGLELRILHDMPAMGINPASARDLSSAEERLLRGLSEDVNLQGLHWAVGPFLKGQI